MKTGPVAGLLLIAGLLLHLFGMLAGGPFEPSAFSGLFHFLGFAAWMAGSFALANDLRLPMVLGFLGVFSIFGIAVMYLIAAKSSRRRKVPGGHDYPWERKSAKRQETEERKNNTFDY